MLSIEANSASGCSMKSHVLLVSLRFKYHQVLARRGQRTLASTLKEMLRTKCHPRTGWESSGGESNSVADTITFKVLVVVSLANEGHVGNLCDQVSDAVTNSFLTLNLMYKGACESNVKTT